MQVVFNYNANFSYFRCKVFDLSQGGKSLKWHHTDPVFIL